jgi:hypothetical protein
MKTKLPQPQSNNHSQQIVWLAIAYAAVLVLVLYPGFHEGFTVRLMFWNALPPTLALVLIITALGKTPRRALASALFGVTSVMVSVYFALFWFFSPLDTDPHSSTTILVFIYAPLFSLLGATIVSAVTWFAIPAGLHEAMPYQRLAERGSDVSRE